MEKKNLTTRAAASSSPQVATRTPVLYGFLKVLIVLFLAYVVFCIGMVVGAHSGRFERYHSMANKCGGYSSDEQVYDMYDMMDEVDMSRVFGTITAVNGNQITIASNAAQELMIISEADTAIMTSSTEIGLSALKVGQNIVTVGTYNTDNQLEVTNIEIVQ